MIGCVKEKRKPRDFTRAFALEIGSGRVEVEDEGAGVLGGFSALGVLGDDQIKTAMSSNQQMIFWQKT